MKIKEFLKEKKLITIVLVSLFMFTAFTVIQSGGGTDMASIHSVSPTSILPYTTTSDGLTYTVEPNGTYLWNGHYLRDPPVPYPKVPTIAPDGLPYGAVGTTGTIGSIGPSTFHKGTTPIISGISPATGVAGTWTSITSTTRWENETLDLVGNVTLNNIGTNLIIQNSIVNFTDEPSTGFGYGFELNNTGLSLFINNSIIEMPHNQLPPFVYTNGGATAYFNNDTIYLNTSNMESIGHINFDLSYLNYSKVSQYYDTSVQGGGMISPFYSYNDIFLNTTVFYQHVLSDSLLINTFIATGGYSSYSLVHDSIKGFFQVGLYGGSAVKNFYINNSKLSFINESKGYTFDNLGIRPSGNNTNIQFDNDSFSYFSVYSGTSGSEFIDTTLYNVINVSAYHITAKNFIWNNGTQIQFLGSSADGVLNVKYSYFYDWDATSAHPGQGSFVNGAFRTGNISYNIFQDLYARINYPLNSANGFSSGGVQQYLQQVGNGITSYGTPKPVGYGIYSQITMEPNWEPYYFTHNFIENLTGQAWAVSMIGRDGNALYNTVVNMNSSNGITASLNSGAQDMNMSYNNFYGAYNYSMLLGGSSGGGAYNDTQYANHFYDIGIHSFAVIVWTSSVKITDADISSLLGINENGTFDFNGSSYNQYEGTYPYNTTIISIVNSKIMNISLDAYKTNTASTVRMLYPHDFNITVDNSYIPSIFWTNYTTPGTFNIKIPIGSFGYGTTYSRYDSTGNPTFISYEGYLGIYSGQIYTLNASNIKNEASLPIYYSGNQVALIPQSATAHYNFEVTGTQATPNYTISANSKQDAPVTLTWNNLRQGQKYSVNLYNNGGLVTNYTYTAGTNGVITFVYNPATMPIDPTFNLTVINSPTHSIPPPVKQPFDYTKFIALSVGFLFILALAYYYGKSKKGGSGGYHGGRRI